MYIVEHYTLILNVSHPSHYTADTIKGVLKHETSGKIYIMILTPITMLLYNL